MLCADNWRGQPSLRLCHPSVRLSVLRTLARPLPCEKKPSVHVCAWCEVWRSGWWNGGSIREKRVLGALSRSFFVWTANQHNYTQRQTPNVRAARHILLINIISLSPPPSSPLLDSMSNELLKPESGFNDDSLRLSLDLDLQ